MPTKVICYSSHTYAQRPDSFSWQGKQCRVKLVEKEWLEPGERHFQVRSEDDKLFELRYQERKDAWSLIEIIGRH